MSNQAGIDPDLKTKVINLKTEIHAVRPSNFSSVLPGILSREKDLLNEMKNIN